MCEVRVYIEKAGTIEERYEDVASIIPKKDQLVLVDIYGGQRFVNAQFKEVNLLDHTVVLEKSNEG